MEVGRARRARRSFPPDETGGLDVTALPLQQSPQI